MKNGFSLVELSIVLVILGLLTGGILSGQSLIRAAELRSVASDFQRYAAAVMSFREKYMALPGDMATATKFWGKDNAACPAHTGTAAAPGTCNGSGDGIITHTGMGGWNASKEAFQAWRHLALAGLVEGEYTGRSGPTGATEYVVGVNSPAAKTGNGSGWALSYQDNSGATSGFSFAYDYQNALMFGAADNNTYMDSYRLNPEEAWNIDTKIDDGMPATGRFHANLYCTNVSGLANVTNFAAVYLFGTSEQRCSVLFRYMN